MEVHLSSQQQRRIAEALRSGAYKTADEVIDRALEQWEQGRREPSGAAKTLIRVAELHPEVLRQIAA